MSFANRSAERERHGLGVTGIEPQQEIPKIDRTAEA